jgi:hypothetical protein
MTLVACSSKFGTFATAPNAHDYDPSSIVRPATSVIPTNVARTTGLVYVSGDLCNCVEIFRKSDGVLIGALTNGVAQAEGLFVDAALNLYVANQSAGNVLVFHEGQTTAFRVLDDPWGWVNDVAVDSDGTTYVANEADFPDNPGDVSVYAPGKTERSAVITDPRFYDLYAVDLDSRHHVYISYFDPNYVSHIDEIIDGRIVDLGLQTRGWGFFDFVLDGNNDIVAQSGSQNHHGISVFPPGHRWPSKRLGIWGTGYMALDASETHIFAVDQGGVAGVWEFSYPNGRLLKTLTGPFGAGNNPIGVAVSPPAKL